MVKAAGEEMMVCITDSIGVLMIDMAVVNQQETKQARNNRGVTQPVKIQQCFTNFLVQVISN